MPSDPGAVEEWLALMPPYGGRVSGRAFCPFRRGVASSEVEAGGAVESFGGEPFSEAEITPRVRGGADGPHYVRGPRAGLLWVLSFLPNWKEAAALRGPSCPACVCVFRAILVP